MMFPNNSLGLTFGREKNIKYAVGEKQGWRTSMQDCFSVSFDLPRHPKYSMFGLFDGHRIRHTSYYLSQQLHLEINKLEKLTTENILNLIITLDKVYIEQHHQNSSGGSTMIFVLVKTSSNFPYKARVFNCGDSRCFQYLSKPKIFKFLSKDHKPNLLEEEKRIRRAGGIITQHGDMFRIDNGINMSRSFGDAKYKKNKHLVYLEQKCIALCDVQETILNKGDYLFLTCDGIFENSNKFDVTCCLLNKLSRARMSTKTPLQLVRRLIENAEKNRSRDNMTAMCLYFKKGKPIKLQTLFEPNGLMEGKRSNRFIIEYLYMAKKYDIKTINVIEQSIQKWLKEQSKEFYKTRWNSEERESLRGRLATDTMELFIYLMNECNHDTNLDIAEIMESSHKFMNKLERL